MSYFPGEVNLNEKNDENHQPLLALMHGWENAENSPSTEDNYLKTLYALHRFNRNEIKEKSRKMDWNAWDPFLFGVVSTNS